MRPEILDILSQREGSIDNEILSKYLSGKLDDMARHEVENRLLQGGNFEEDALEGWHKAAHTPVLIKHADEINRKLLQQLHSGGTLRKRKAIRDFPLLWWVIGFVIILTIIAWAFIYYLGNQADY